MNDKFQIAEENEQLFYHERHPERRMWSGRYRGITFEILYWEWSSSVTEIASSLSKGNWCQYLYINIDEIPDKKVAEGLWLPAEPWRMPTFEDAEDPHLQELNRLAKQMNELYEKEDRRLYPYSEHPILQEIDFSGGITFYEREYSDQHKIIKIGCDFQHSWDMGKNYTVNDIIDWAKRSIDSWHDLVPGYGEKE